MNSGIYFYTNMHNNKFYLGSTLNFKARQGRHLRDLRRNKHPNSYLQNAFNKYGEENFKFKLIEYIEPNTKKLEEVEQKYLDKYFGKDYCYNLNPKADRPPDATGRKISNRHKEKLRQCNLNNQNWLGKKHSIETKEKLRQINSGKIILESTKNKISQKLSGKKHSIERNLKKAKYYKLISPEGKVYEGIGLKDFCLQNNLCRTCINHVLNNRRSHHKGWIKYE